MPQNKVVGPSPVTAWLQSDFYFVYKPEAQS